MVQIIRPRTEAKNVKQIDGKSLDLKSNIRAVHWVML